MKISFGRKLRRVSVPVTLDTIQSKDLCFPLVVKKCKNQNTPEYNLPVLLEGKDTWSLTLREEHKLMVLENEVLRRIFGPKRIDVTEGQRKPNNEELHDLYSSPSIMRMRWAGHVARIGEKVNAYRSLDGKPEGKRPLGSPGSRWVDNIKLDLGEIEWAGVDWIGQAQDRDKLRTLVDAVMNLRVP
jgi:hypothetical protein